MKVQASTQFTQNYARLNLNTGNNPIASSQQVGVIGRRTGRLFFFDDKDTDELKSDTFDISDLKQTKMKDYQVYSSESKSESFSKSEAESFELESETSSSEDNETEKEGIIIEGRKASIKNNNNKYTKQFEVKNDVNDIGNKKEEKNKEIQQHNKDKELPMFKTKEQISLLMEQKKKEKEKEIQLTNKKKFVNDNVLSTIKKQNNKDEMSLFEDQSFLHELNNNNNNQQKVSNVKGGRNSVDGNNDTLVLDGKIEEEFNEGNNAWNRKQKNLKNFTIQEENEDEGEDINKISSKGKEVDNIVELESETGSDDSEIKDVEVNNNKDNKQQNAKKKNKNKKSVENVEIEKINESNVSKDKDKDNNNNNNSVQKEKEVPKKNNKKKNIKNIKKKDFILSENSEEEKESESESSSEESPIRNKKQAKKNKTRQPKKSAKQKAKAKPTRKKRFSNKRKSSFSDDYDYDIDDINNINSSQKIISESNSSKSKSPPKSKDISLNEDNKDKEKVSQHSNSPDKSQNKSLSKENKENKKNKQTKQKSTKSQYPSKPIKRKTKDIIDNKPPSNPKKKVRATQRLRYDYSKFNEKIEKESYFMNNKPRLFTMEIIHDKNANNSPKTFGINGRYSLRHRFGRLDHCIGEHIKYIHGKYGDTASQVVTTQKDFNIEERSKKKRKKKLVKPLQKNSTKGNNMLEDDYSEHSDGDNKILNIKPYSQKSEAQNYSATLKITIMESSEDNKIIIGKKEYKNVKKNDILTIFPNATYSIKNYSDDKLVMKVGVDNVD